MVELRCGGRAEPALLLHLQKTTVMEPQAKLEPCRGGPGDRKRDLRERERKRRRKERREREHGKEKVPGRRSFARSCCY